MTPELKLYIWGEFCPDYHDGLAFAIAETRTQAKNLVRAEYGSEPYLWGPLVIRPIEECARCVVGGS